MEHFNKTVDEYVPVNIIDSVAVYLVLFNLVCLSYLFVPCVTNVYGGDIFVCVGVL